MRSAGRTSSVSPRLRVRAHGLQDRARRMERGKREVGRGRRQSVWSVCKGSRRGMYVPSVGNERTSSWWCRPIGAKELQAARACSGRGPLDLPRGARDCRRLRLTWPRSKGLRSARSAAVASSSPLSYDDTGLLSSAARTPQRLPATAAALIRTPSYPAGIGRPGSLLPYTRSSRRSSSPPSGPCVLAVSPAPFCRPLIVPSAPSRRATSPVPSNPRPPHPTLSRPFHCPTRNPLTSTSTGLSPSAVSLAWSPSPRTQNARSRRGRS